MDNNTELMIIHAAPVQRWEDEDKSTNNLEELRREFRERLYAATPDGTEKEL